MVWGRRGTTRVQDAPRPTGLAFDAPTKAKSGLPDDDPNSVSTKWGAIAGFPCDRCSGVRRSRPQANNELVFCADSGDRMLRHSATPMEINRHSGFR